MKGDDRKAALAAYKERAVSAGIYAVRCAAADAVWVGAAPDLSTIQNRLWFQLRLKGCPCRALQAAWDAHGADGVTFEVLERLEDEEIAYARTAALKARAAHWGEALNAPVI
ncbi:GIY-YIG nuclease family protein [Azospirillum sp. sgz301742]